MVVIAIDIFVVVIDFTILIFIFIIIAVEAGGSVVTALLTFALLAWFSACHHVSEHTNSTQEVAGIQLSIYV